MTVPRHALRAVAGGLAAIALATALAACGGDARDDVATDTGPTAAPTSTASGPTEEPKPGSLPAYPHTDYAYTLEQRCFCANVDQRYRITVVDGEVASVTWATAGEGHAVGDAVVDAAYLSLTIQDIIDQGNDPQAAQVDVEWPAGQEYPTSVYIDKDKMVADEEVTWVISDVETT